MALSGISRAMFIYPHSFSLEWVACFLVSYTASVVDSMVRLCCLILCIDESMCCKTALG